MQFRTCRRCGTVAQIEGVAVSEALEQAAHDKDFDVGRGIVGVERDTRGLLTPRLRCGGVLSVAEAVTHGQRDREVVRSRGGQRGHMRPA